MQLQISFHGLPHSNVVQQAITERAAKLERFYEHIVSCRVVVELTSHHSRSGNQYNVRVDLKVPGGEIAVTHEHSEDLHAAVHDAFDATRRRLEDFARKQRGDVKRHAS
jgi:ribosomal subunit interface protein